LLLSIAFCGFAVPAAAPRNRSACAGLDRYPDTMVTELIPVLSCHACRPNAPFAELVKLYSRSIADEAREERRWRMFGE
jgi:hypothetical protein